MSENTKDNSSKAKKITREVIGYVIAIISAVVLAILIRTFIFEPFIVPTPSMEPTLMVGDKVIINKLSYRFTDIERGDVVAFHSATEDDKELVKRVIAVEGDEISLTNEGEIFINGEKLDEHYIPDDQDIKYLNEVRTIGQGEVFVMGDNRNNSFDSRFFGNIPEDKIFGEFVIIYWPPSRW